MHIAKSIISRVQGGEYIIFKLNKKNRISTKAIFAMLFYLIIPLIAISIILTSYPELSKDRFIRAIYWIVPMSLILIIISQISTKYEKGETKKFILNISYVFATLLWIYGFIGGNIILQEKWLEYEFQIHLWKYITLIFIAAAINIFYYTIEYRYYSKEKSKETKKPFRKIHFKKQTPAKTT